MGRESLKKGVSSMVATPRKKSKCYRLNNCHYERCVATVKRRKKILPSLLLESQCIVTHFFTLPLAKNEEK